MSLKRSEKNNKRKARRKRQELKIAGRVAKPRACDSCYACCKVYPLQGLPEYDDVKPAGETCKWVCDNEKARCSTYDSRPLVCSSYRCVWIHDGSQKQRLFFANERPDILGVIFDLTPPDHVATKALGGNPVLIAREFREGAFRDHEVTTTINRFVDLGKTVVLALSGGEMRFISHSRADADAVELAYKKQRLFKVISDQVEAEGGPKYHKDGMPDFDPDLFQIDLDNP